MPRVRVRGSTKDKDLGFKRLAAELGELGSVTLGVQGKEAKERHPNAEMSVGELAALHELGLGVPRRSWLIDWLAANEGRMRKQAAEAFQHVMARRTTRNKALIALGYEWTAQIRQRIVSGQVPPPNAPATIERKGHGIPLLDTNVLHNSITYRVFLRMKKSIRDAAQRGLIK